MYCLVIYFNSVLFLEQLNSRTMKRMYLHLSLQICVVFVILDIVLKRLVAFCGITVVINDTSTSKQLELVITWSTFTRHGFVITRSSPLRCAFVIPRSTVKQHQQLHTESLHLLVTRTVWQVPFLLFLPFESFPI